MTDETEIDETEEALNVLARFIGRAVNVPGDLDAIEALTTVRSHLTVLDFAAADRWKRMEAAEEALRKIEQLYPRGEPAFEIAHTTLEGEA